VAASFTTTVARLAKQAADDAVTTLARLAAESGAAPQQPLSERVERAVAALHELGGTLGIEPTEPQWRGLIRLRGYSCPLASAATSHGEAFLAKAVDARVTACCEREGRPRYCFEITPGRKRVA
jgi:hypothetical protein